MGIKTIPRRVHRLHRALEATAGGARSALTLSRDRSRVTSRTSDIRSWDKAADPERLISGQVSEAKPTCRRRRDSDVLDPHVWSGRALQEIFVDLADAVLHQCIRSLIGARRGSRPSWISARVRAH